MIIDFSVVRLIGEEFLDPIYLALNFIEMGVKIHTVGTVTVIQLSGKLQLLRRRCGGKTRDYRIELPSFSVPFF